MTDLDKVLQFTDNFNTELRYNEEENQVWCYTYSNSLILEDLQEMKEVLDADKVEIMDGVETDKFFITFEL